MERFVTLVVAGGLTLVAGLWTVELAPDVTLSLAGAALALLGVAGLAAGIGDELEY
jgi:hypothetical protein